MLLASMCRDVRLVGQLGAGLSSDDGSRRHRAPYVGGFHATPTGGYRQVRRHEVVTVGPVGRDRLRAELTDLLEQC